VDKYWKDFFNNPVALEANIAYQEDIEDIVSMFIEDRIDPILFNNNIEALLRGGMPSASDLFLEKPKILKPSKSLTSFISIVNRPVGTPLWFLAAYPDVIDWLNEQDKQYMELHKGDDDGWLKEILKLLDISSIENADTVNILIRSSDGKPTPKYYYRLKNKYKEISNSKFETSVDENSINNPYLGAEFLKMIGAESNFTLIAENTTKYYLELNYSHKNRISNDITLLAAAGVLDAQYYIFAYRSISIPEIIHMAKKAISSGSDPLLNFIVELEIKIFMIDSPELGFNRTEKACIGQKDAILKAILKTKENYRGESKVASEVKLFMNHSKFASYRKMLGIKNRFLFF
jgi:hypothetical protein